MNEITRKHNNSIDKTLKFSQTKWDKVAKINSWTKCQQFVYGYVYVWIGEEFNWCKNLKSYFMESFIRLKWFLFIVVFEGMSRLSKLESKSICCFL